jgi:hypothetical protein
VADRSAAAGLPAAGKLGQAVFCGHSFGPPCEVQGELAGNKHKCRTFISTSSLESGADGEHERIASVPGQNKTEKAFFSEKNVFLGFWA